jgi:hypothetical protein
MDFSYIGLTIIGGKVKEWISIFLFCIGVKFGKSCDEAILIFFLVDILKPGTPTSFAPAVSVFGMIISAISLMIVPCSGVRNTGFQSIVGLAVHPCNTPRIAGAESALPINSAVRLRASLLSIVVEIQFEI